MIAFVRDCSINFIFGYWHFLIASIFKSLCFLKWCPIIDSLTLHQFSKFNNFFWVSWFLFKHLSNFVSPAWKLDNLYYHTCQGIFVIRPIETFVVTKVELLSNIICVRICGNYYCTITSFVKSSLKLYRNKIVFYFLKPNQIWKILNFLISVKFWLCVGRKNDQNQIIVKVLISNNSV